MVEKRYKRAVLITVEDLDSNYRIRFDDVISDDANMWRNDILYTYIDYPKQTLEDLEFSDEDLKKFGLTLLARLYAFQKRREI